MPLEDELVCSTTYVQRQYAGEHWYTQSCTPELCWKQSICFNREIESYKDKEMIIFSHEAEQI